ncbi:ankyrin-1-like [Triticum aestivum]|uniref:ankyrin-1-like n=1 Tax=Triticum aestivum TaxID=4565 RepID=UPI001D028314|nr:ankyrin-1-like [Triticum aestivum]
MKEEKAAASPHPVLKAALEGNLRLLKGTAGSLVADECIWIRALCVAVMEGRLDICAYLVEDLRVDVNQPNDLGETVLFISATFGTVAAARYLLDRGADPMIPGRLGSPLHTATMNGNCEIVELLLSRGADVDVFDSKHGTPLHAATNLSEVGPMKVLLEHHADPNKVLNLHSTPLSMAIQRESLECVKLLIEAGADVNKTNYIGVTQLMVAANNGLPDIMRCLLDAGANANIGDSFGTTPIEIAALKGRRSMVEILFPLTSLISTLPDWSIDGIMSHVKSFGLKPRDKNKCEKRRAELKLQATEAFNRKEYLIAGKLYTCAMKFDPSPKDLAILLANRSFCLLRLGRGKDAPSDADACTMVRPRWPKGYYRKGAALMLQEDYEKASEAFEDGLKLDPTNVDIANW